VKEPRTADQTSPETLAILFVHVKHDFSGPERGESQKTGSEPQGFSVTVVGQLDMLGGRALISPRAAAEDGVWLPNLNWKVDVLDLVGAVFVVGRASIPLANCLHSESS
jgi:hypothetical protein